VGSTIKLALKVDRELKKVGKHCPRQPTLRVSPKPVSTIGKNDEIATTDFEY